MQAALIASLEAKIRIDEESRKKLHNTIQELKGNIRVYARIRPSAVASSSYVCSFTLSLSGSLIFSVAGWGLKNEWGMHAFFLRDEVKFVAVPDTDERGLDVTGASQKSADGLKTQQKSWSFEFDKVFMPTATQADVFVEISQLVQSALDGYKVSIMSFGQTGSGKTFTMEGPSSDAQDENRGMIPRAVEQIFAHCSALEAKGWRYQLEVMFLGTCKTDTLRACPG